MIRAFEIVGARLRVLARWRRFDVEFDEELATHLAEAEDEYRRRGLSDDDARLAAIRDIGGISQTKERYRDGRWGRPFDTVAQDIRYAVRVLRKSPRFTASIVLTLTLAIGATTAIFTVIDALMLRELPVRDPHALVVVGDPAAVHSWSWGTPRTNVFSFPLYRELRDRNRTFSSLFASARLDNLQIAIDGPAEPIDGRLVTGNYFETLGVEPVIGHTFTAQDDRVPGADPYLVISFAYWERRFGRDPSAVGRVVRLKNQRFTIVGVAPPDFFGEVVGDRPQVWAPMMMEPQLMPGRDFLNAVDTHALLLMGRLGRGVTIEQARADVAAVVREALTDTLAGRLSADDRDAMGRGEVTFVAELSEGAHGLSRMRRQFSEPLLLLMGMVTLVLVVTSVNIASLMLARSAARRRELSLRVALGAGPGRLVRQLLTESILLVVVGGVFGLGVASRGAATLVHLASRSASTEPLVLGLDARVLGFTVLVCFVGCVVFGLVPALACLRNTDITAPKRRAGRALVTAQVAIGVAVIMAAALLVRSLGNLQRTDLGFERDELLVATVDLLAGGYRDERAHAITRELLDRLSAIPGVRHVTVSTNGLFKSNDSSHSIRVEGAGSIAPAEVETHRDDVGPDYFSTIGVPIVSGREITSHDFAASARVAVVNETFVDVYFGRGNPLGRRVTIEDSRQPGEPAYEIVGVARDVRDHAIRAAIPPRLYVPLTSGARDNPVALTFEVRTSVRPDRLKQDVRDAIRAASSTLVIDTVTTAHQLVDDTLALPALVARWSLAFGALVLMMICVGIYATMSYRVSSRTTEIAVRLALGAPRSTILWMAAREVALMVTAGIAIGVPIGIAVTRAFDAMLFGVAPADPASVAYAAGAVMLTAGAAAILPARRATRIESTVALRHD
ncbi:MAG TPA: ABC transporter permease [Vicinamibacterales bacterium]|nr:ABC transporter permease [Vicinamibacterales bacterium]